MIEFLDQTALAVMDFLLGWSLHLPSDITLLLLALTTTVILAGVRPFTTRQDFLRRCSADRRQLRKLIRDARKRGDAEAGQRHRNVLGRISMRAFRAEIPPLLVALVPIAALATWGFQRMEFRPPRDGQSFRIAAVFPASASGDLVHLAPDEDESLQVEGGWIREIIPNYIHEQESKRATAEWTLHGPARTEPYLLRFRRGTMTWERKIRIGDLTYPDPISLHDDGLIEIQLKMKEVKLFNIVPGIRPLGIPAWLVAYLLLTIPLAFISRRAFRIS